jgi:hypothetical protein
MFSRRWLFMTNTLSSGGLLALGDGIQQSIERRRGQAIKHDWARTGNYITIYRKNCSISLIIIITITYTYYIYNVRMIIYSLERSYMYVTRMTIPGV